MSRMSWAVKLILPRPPNLMPFGHSRLFAADAEPAVEVVAEGPERDAHLVAAPLQLAIGPLEETVGDDPVDHEEHAEAEEGGDEGLAPAQPGAGGTLLGRPEDRADQDQRHHDRCVESGHLCWSPWPNWTLYTALRERTHMLPEGGPDLLSGSTTSARPTAHHPLSPGRAAAVRPGGGPSLVVAPSGDLQCCAGRKSPNTATSTSQPGGRRSPGRAPSEVGVDRDPRTPAAPVA